MTTAVDLFAGPGGWSVACAQLGITETGIEHDPAACATRSAAGHRTVQADVAALDPADHPADGLIASPPCPAFSSAGKQEGREHLPALADAIRQRDWKRRPDPDPRIWLALEIGRWYEHLHPEWVALEQVPAVSPLWAAYAAILTADGYSVWHGKLNAADYGVPQTRTRAVLIASRTRPARRPTPTHSKTGDTLPLWVSMAEALPELAAPFLVGFPRLDDKGTSADGYRDRDRRPDTDPAFVITEKARSWTVNTGRDWKPGGTRADAQILNADDSPAPTLTAKAPTQWHLHRPATTVQRNPRIWPPGHKINQDDIDRLGHDEATARYGDRAGSEAIRLTVDQALALQTFPRDYPIKGRAPNPFRQLTLDCFDPDPDPEGSRSKQFEQIGNAVPPLLAWHILAAITGHTE